MAPSGAGMPASSDLMDACLQPVQRRVASTRADELLVGTVLDEASTIDSDDAVRAAHGREPVRDNEDCTPARNLLHVCLDRSLALVVKRAGCLVEYQDAWIHDERTGDRDALALAAREAAAALADHRVVTLRHLQDELVRTGELRGRHDPLDLHGRVRERDVVPN